MAPSPASDSAPGEPSACKQCDAPLDAGANFCAVCGAAAAGDAMPDPLIGRVVADRYRIMQLIGRGGMGVVYKCEHTRMGKVMAIKLLHGDLARDVEVQRRFRREAQAASKLSHPSTVSIFDFGTSDGLMYLVMEYVHGEDLGRILRTEVYLAPTRAAAIAAQACGSLAEAHEEGIVHRDLKPENLLISKLKDGREYAKLLDFGLAKLREGEERNEITGAGTLVGTPYYMAPEVIRGNPADHRVDIYALGALLYRAVSGTPPFTGSSPVAVLTRHLTDELVAPSKRRPDLAIPRDIDAIVLKCMEKDPARRYQRITDVHEALTTYLASEGITDSLLSDSTTRRSAIGVKTPASGTRGAMPVATRNDVEAFERQLRRGKILSRAVVCALAAVTLGGAGLLYRHQVLGPQRPRDVEVEPNNAPTRATLVAPDTDVRGRVGQRIAPRTGDVDFYRLAAIPPGEWRLRVELAPQPNIDSVVELHRAGQPAAIAVADDAPEGGREVIAGFRVQGGGEPYYLAVHEHLREQGWPSENVTDQYTLRYSLSRVTTDEETEPNDRIEVAASIAPGGSRRGYLESRDDVDHFCLEMGVALGPFQVALEPPPGLDVELVVHPRDGAPERVIDDARAGGAERATLERPAGGRAPCLVVRASRARRPDDRGDPDHTYVLRVERP